MGSILKPKFQGQLKHDKWTGQRLLVPHQYHLKCVQPAQLIKRKLSLFPVQSQYLCISVEPIITDEKIIEVPVYPKAEQVVLVHNKPHKHKYINVIKVQSTTVTGNILDKIVSPCWRVKRKKVTVPLISVVQLIQYNETRIAGVLKLEVSTVKLLFHINI